MPRSDAVATADAVPGAAPAGGSAGSTLSASEGLGQTCPNEARSR